jgi:CRP-like cAMP-binding protein
LVQSLKSDQEEEDSYTRAKLGFQFSGFQKNGLNVVRDELINIISLKLLYPGAQLDRAVKLAGYIPAFQKYDLATRKALCKVIKYEKVGNNRTVVRQGGDAFFFYLVLSGKLSVYSSDNGRRVQLATLETGDAFGEMALLKDTKRMATVVTTADTEFFQVHKDDFKRVLESEVQRDFETKIEILKGVAGFCDMPEEVIKALAATGRMKEYRANEVMINEGELIDQVTLIW